MGRLIDADRLKKHYAWWAGNEREMTMDEAKSDFDTIIDLQPTAEPKHGRWIWVNGWVECSVCGCEPPNESNCESDYCPHCGARMDGGESDK